MKLIQRFLAASLGCILAMNLAMADTPEQRQASTTVNQLSSQFLLSKLKHDGLKNTLVSSVSLFYALSILHNGANGETEDLLRSILLADVDSTVNEASPALAEVLVSPRSTGQSGAGVFRLANSLWSTNGATNKLPFVFAEPFTSNTATHYNAIPHSIDFLASNASTAINQWADENTDGLIREIIDDETLRAFQWLIMNAAYFEGAWSTPMRAIEAGDDYVFRALDGSEKPVDTIRTVDYEARVVDNEDGSVAFKLPFIGGKYSFVVYMPAEQTDITRWLTQHGPATIADVVKRVLENRSQVYRLSIRLPVFAFSDQLAMRKGSNIANDLGLAPLFSDYADFSALVDVEQTSSVNAATKVGLIKQNTKIELDENGVKAAAVTLVGGIGITSVAPPLPVRTFVVDRPFAFAIVENSSQTLLFNGILTEPG